MTNLFSIATKDTQQERFETLLQTSAIHIEKITSHGQVSNQWYEQSRDEWVLLVEGEGELLFENGSRLRLNKGEHTYIPKMKKHKVVYTASPTIWLAIHFDTAQ